MDIQFAKKNTARSPQCNLAVFVFETPDMSLRLDAEIKHNMHLRWTSTRPCQMTASHVCVRRVWMCDFYIPRTVIHISWAGVCETREAVILVIRD